MGSIYIIGFGGRRFTMISGLEKVNLSSFDKNLSAIPPLNGVVERRNHHVQGRYPRFCLFLDPLEDVQDGTAKMASTMVDAVCIRSTFLVLRSSGKTAAAAT